MSEAELKAAEDRAVREVIAYQEAIKHGHLEEAAMLEARIHEAAAYVPLERLALSPPYGSARLVIDDQPTSAVVIQVNGQERQRLC